MWSGRSDFSGKNRKKKRAVAPIAYEDTSSGGWGL